MKNKTHRWQKNILELKIRKTIPFFLFPNLQSKNGSFALFYHCFCWTPPVRWVFQRTVSVFRRSKWRYSFSNILPRWWIFFWWNCQSMRSNPSILFQVLLLAQMHHHQNNNIENSPELVVVFLLVVIRGYAWIHGLVFIFLIYWWKYVGSKIEETCCRLLRRNHFGE